MVRQMMRVVVLAALCCAPLVAGQNAQDVFRSESDLVVLHVNVFNGRSDAVPELPQSAFSVFEMNSRRRSRSSAVLTFRWPSGSFWTTAAR
jgi:hypothetical protein